MTEDRGHPNPRRPRGRPPHPDVLTPAEWRVLDALRLGHTNAEIAERLGLSVNTVRTHVSSMLTKLELPDRHALATWDGQPVERSRSAIRRLSFVTPWLRLAAGGAVLVGFVVIIGAALDSSRASAPSDDEPLVTAEPEATRTSEPVALADIYSPQPYIPPDDLGGWRGTRPLPSRFPPPSIDAANAEPAAFLGDAWPQPPDSPAFADAPGSRDRNCVDTASIAGPVVRSGDFLLDTSAWPDAPHLFALTAPDGAQRLFLRALHLDSSAPRAATLIHEFANSGDGATGGRFAPTFVLPEAGRWLVVATAGPQWGCFVVAVPEPPETYRPARTVAEAEQAGATYPTSPPPAHLTGRFTATAPFALPSGGHARACLDIDGLDAVRSGEWLMLAAQMLIDGDPNAPSNRVFLIPVTQPRGYDELERWRGTPLLGLRLTATFLDAPQHTYVYEQPEPNAYTPYDGFDEDGFEFQHITQAVLPRTGDWVVVATDGPGGSQWGCFTSPGRGTPASVAGD
ncbi:MAG: LuxR C-terminal-related transcriptional regulator [Dehalococcoidia bacterium]|nr:LuxR C-terminal-related transcriptional regulator [Dehalococcoidia bacterium]